MSSGPRVRFTPIPASGFEVWRAAALRRYADGKVRARVWKESEALSLGEKEFHQVMPDGLTSRDHEFSLILDNVTGEVVGSVWFQLIRARSPPLVQLWDIVIDE